MDGPVAGEHRAGAGPAFDRFGVQQGVDEPVLPADARVDVPCAEPLGDDLRPVHRQHPPLHGVGEQVPAELVVLDAGGHDQQCVGCVGLGAVLTLVVLPGLQHPQQGVPVGDVDAAAAFLRPDAELPIAAVGVAAVDEQEPPPVRLGQPVFDQRLQHPPVDLGRCAHPALSSPPTVRHTTSISAPGCSRA